MEKSPLLLTPQTRLELEGGAWRQGYEVESTAFEVAHASGQKGDPGSQSEPVVRRDVEATDILPRDLGIGADVDDVYSVSAAPKTFDDLGDDALCDQCLSKADLIGDEKAVRRVGNGVEAAEDVVYRRPLEVLEPRQHSRRIGSRLAQVVTRWRTVQMGSQMASTPSGSSAAPAVVFLGSRTRMAI